MKKVKLFSIFIGVAALSFVYWHTVYAEVSNRVVAIVNNEVITLYELNSKIRELTGLEPRDLEIKDKKGYLETRRKVLDILIEQKIANEKIRELGISLNPKEVDGTIEKIKEQNQLTHEDLIASLKKQGISYESYREIVKQDLERVQLINLEVKSKIIIREEKVREYYNEHKDKFTTQEKVHLAAIFLNQKNGSDQKEALALRQKAQHILDRLKLGEDFGGLAREFSSGPGAGEGGDLGFFRTKELDPLLLEAIKGLSRGSVSEPIITPSGIRIVKLLEKQEGRIKPLEEVKDAIYGLLYREEVNRRYSSWIKELKEKAYTKIIF